MPKRHQQRPAKETVGVNNPEKSTEITTGTYKKHETYEKQAAEHKNPGKLPQESHVKPSFDPTEGRSHQAESREVMHDGETRSGSHSNANKHRKHSTLHESAQKEPHAHPKGEDYWAEMEGTDFEGGNYGLRGPAPVDYNRSANDIKSLHAKLADLTDDELKNIQFVPEGQHLEQGATYIDLRHLEQGEFTARANMVAEPGSYYVPKKEVGYVLWNRLNQVDNPARLDESDTSDQ